MSHNNTTSVQQEPQVDANLFRDVTTLDVHPTTLRHWYQLMHLGRLLDEKAARYLKMSKGWSYHAPCAGHEGIQLAMGITFRPGVDFLFPYYRDLMTSLAAGLTPEEIILNGLSKDTDVAGGGRHMSNHFAKPSIGIQNVSSCTGNHSLHATGVARAIKKYEGDAIAIYSSGESATSEGYFYEAVSGACREQLPVLFVIQNNGYGISVPVHEQSPSTNIADNFRGFKNLLVLNCDGTNIFDSWRTMQDAAMHARSGGGPVMIHAECVRIGAHSNSDRQELYRSPEELEEARQRDPLQRFRAYILQHELFTEDEIAAIESENQATLELAAEKAEAAPEPSQESAHMFVFPDDTHVCPLSDEQLTKIADSAAAGGSVSTFREAINETLHEEFRRNPNTFLWGQDVASRDKGGIFNVTKGMLHEFGKERIFNAPIAEDFILGTANGFARYRDDIWVVVEGAEFADYFWPAMEQLVETTHEYWRTKGQFAPNIVVRLASGGYIQGGLYHSQSIEGSLAAIPGLRIVIPSFADDATGLLRCAMRTRGITMYLEPKHLYNHAMAKAARPAPSYCVPIGRARVRREGADLSIVTYGTPVHFALQAAERLAKEENISVEVLDLRSLIPYDKDAIAKTVQKTGKVMVLQEANRTGGFGGEIAAWIAEEQFAFLDAPVMRLGSKDIPVGFAKNLEKEVLVNADDVYATALKLAKY
ncbi:MAG: 2-oxoisovalerate dehydrogenase [Ignavibacteriae bacterium]|nr:2-oxoisovalerate dehydrogenase [Ignavibacteriota bacterium]